MLYENNIEHYNCMKLSLLTYVQIEAILSNAIMLEYFCSDVVTLFKQPVNSLISIHLIH